MTDAGFKKGWVYRELVRQAMERDLIRGPYGGRQGAGQAQAFVNGYETALSDIANGALRLPERQP